MADAEIWTAPLNHSQASIVWPKVAEILSPSVEMSSGLWTLEDLHERVVNRDGDFILWIICDKDQILGSWVTKVQHFPRGRVLEIVFAGGSDMERWYEQALGATESFAIALGCDRLRGYGRRGWLKYGYRGIGYIVERVIT